MGSPCTWGVFPIDVTCGPIVHGEYSPAYLPTYLGNCYWGCIHPHSEFPSGVGKYTSLVRVSHPSLTFTEFHIHVRNS